MKRKILWLMSMAALCLVLYTIVVSRLESGTNIIFGGQSGAFIRTDSANYNVTPTPSPEPTVDIWPKLSTKDFEDNTYLQIVNNNNLLSSAYEPGGLRLLHRRRVPLLLVSGPRVQLQGQPDRGRHGSHGLS